MKWVLEIFVDHEYPYVIHVWSKFLPDPDRGFQDITILLQKTNFLEGF
jgi:hypothetical protein